MEKEVIPHPLELKNLSCPSENLELINMDRICRLCGKESTKLIGIHTREGTEYNLSTTINLYLPIKVRIDDDLPQQCCLNCTNTLSSWHDFFLASIESDRRFRVIPLVTETGSPDDQKTTTLTVTFQTKSGPNSPEASNVDELDRDDSAPSSPQAEKAKLVATKARKCDICNKIVSRARDLARHQLLYHSFSDKTFDKVANLETKTCLECSETFENRLQLKSHVKTVHKIIQQVNRRKMSEIEDRPYSCAVCKKRFVRKFDMEKHKKLKHRTEAAAPKDENKSIVKECRIFDKLTGTSTFKCDLCDRLFRQSYNLIRHRSIHFGVRPFCCDACGAKFRMATALKRHINSIHRKIKKFACTMCERAFSTRANLDQHQNIHSDTRPFVCDECGKCFRQKATLTVHKLFHTDSFKFECGTCGKKCKRRHDLKVHEWLHEGRRLFACGKCPASFRRAYDLKRHERTHLKHGECLCDVCGSAFSQERYLKAHKKIHLADNNKGN